VTTVTQDRYGRDIPFLLRLLGCRAIHGGRWPNYRFKWGEVAPRWGLSAQYSVYHEEANVNLCLIWGSVHIKAPMLITQRENTEDWNASYGFTYFERAFQFKWRTRCKIIRLPWDWEHVRHTFLNLNGSVHHHEEKRRGHFEQAPEGTKMVCDYIYVRRSGEVQHRTATINGEEREWRWRWFTWCPWPSRVSRSINVEFDREIGEEVGTWKGGTVGCGWDWRHDESALESLRRMERERKFSR
jgi:hypothetical protein